MITVYNPRTKEMIRREETKEEIAEREQRIAEFEEKQRLEAKARSEKEPLTVEERLAVLEAMLGVSV